MRCLYDDIGIRKKSVDSFTNEAKSALTYAFRKHFKNPLPYGVCPNNQRIYAIEI